MTVTVGSLFSGLGGIDLAFERAGCDVAWQVELDREANRVLRRHWPEVERFEDVRSVGRHNLRPVDIIAFGSPCQDVSVAGKRGGINGERSGLFFEATRVIGELRPALVLIENVPGLFSSNDGADLQIVLDSLTQIGYACDVEIKDAQEFGVPQRRRRAFIACVRSDVLLQKKTSSFASIVMDLTAQCLLAKWDATLQASSPEQRPWGCESPIAGWRGSPQRRMRLFTALLGKSPLRKLVEYWAVGPAAQSWNGWIDSESGELGDGRGHTSIAGATESCPQRMARADGSGSASTSQTLRKSWAENSDGAKSSTISTATNSTTTQQICTSAETIVSMLTSIIPLMSWSENSWSAASSCSMLLKEVTQYARQASSQLLTEPALHSRWRACFDAASDLSGEFERCTGAIRAAEILLESSGVFGHPPASRNSRSRIAGTSEECLGSGSEIADCVTSSYANSAATAGNNARPVNVIVSALTTNGVGVAGADENQAQAGHLVSTLPIPILEATSRQGVGADKRDGIGIGAPGDPMFTLSVSQQHGVATAVNTGHGWWSDSDQSHTLTHRDPKEARTLVVEPTTTHALTGEGADASEDGTGRGTPLAAAEKGMAGWGVRRLTPLLLECERLMGLPDCFTRWDEEGKELSDSARYRLVGNSVAIPVVEWIACRMVHAIASGIEEVAS